MKRRLFAEVAEGFNALAKERLGKNTLRTVELEAKPAPEVSAEVWLKNKRCSYLLAAKFSAAVVKG